MKLKIKALFTCKWNKLHWPPHPDYFLYLQKISCFFPSEPPFPSILQTSLELCSSLHVVEIRTFWRTSCSQNLLLHWSQASTVLYTTCIGWVSCFLFSMCFVLVGFPVLYSLCVLYWFVFLFYIFYVFCIFPSWASPVWNQTCLALRALTGGKPAFATHCTVRTVFCSCMRVFCTLKSRKPASFTSLVSRSVPYLSGTLHLWGGIADTSDTRANQPPSTHLHLSLQLFLHIVSTEVCHDTSDTGANQQSSTHLTPSPPPKFPPNPPSLHQHMSLLSPRQCTQVNPWHKWHNL